MEITKKSALKAAMSIVFGIGFYTAMFFGLYWMHEGPFNAKGKLESAFVDGKYQEVIRLFEDENNDLPINAVVEQVAISYLSNGEVKKSQKIIQEYVSNRKTSAKKLDAIFEMVDVIGDSTGVIDVRKYIEFFKYEFPEDPYFSILSAYYEECAGNFKNGLSDLQKVYQSGLNDYQFTLALACLNLRYERYVVADKLITHLIDQKHLIRDALLSILQGEEIDTVQIDRLLVNSEKIPNRFLHYSIISSLRIVTTMDGTVDEAAYDNYYSKLHLLRSFCRFKAAMFDDALADLKATETEELWGVFISGPGCQSAPSTLTITKEILMDKVYQAKCKGK